MDQTRLQQLRRIAHELVPRPDSKPHLEQFLCGCDSVAESHPSDEQLRSIFKELRFDFAVLVLSHGPDAEQKDRFAAIEKLIAEFKDRSSTKWRNRS